MNKSTFIIILAILSVSNQLNLKSSKKSMIAQTPIPELTIIGTGFFMVHVLDANSNTSHSLTATSPGPINFEAEDNTYKYDLSYFSLKDLKDSKLKITVYNNLVEQIQFRAEASIVDQYGKLIKIESKVKDFVCEYPGKENMTQPAILGNAVYPSLPDAESIASAEKYEAKGIECIWTLPNPEEGPSSFTVSRVIKDNNIKLTVELDKIIPPASN